MVDYVKLVISRYAEFSGRSRRSEYWYWTLAVFIGAILTSIIDGIIGVPVTYILFLLATIVPGLAVAVRRLHDTGRSGWWLLIGLIPLVGPILLIVWMATDSAPGANQYGPNPKGQAGLPGGGYAPPPGQQWGQDGGQPQWGQQPPGQPQQPQQWGQQPPQQPQWGAPPQQGQQPPAQPQQPQWGQGAPDQGWGQQPPAQPQQPQWGEQPQQPPAQPGWGQPSGGQDYPPPPGS